MLGVLARNQSLEWSENDVKRGGWRRNVESKKGGLSPLSLAELLERNGWIFLGDSRW